MWRNPSTVRWWFLPLAVVVLFAVTMSMAVAGASLVLVTVVVGVFVVVVVGATVFDAVHTPRRSARVRAGLHPAAVAAAVDLDRLATVANSGHPKAHAAAAGLVQRSFPQLTKADALAVVRATVPTPWPHDGATPRVSAPGVGLPPPVRPLVLWWTVPVVLVLVVLAVLVDDLGWKVFLLAFVAGIGLAATAVDQVRRTRGNRAWTAVPTAMVAAHVDVAGLAVVRRDEGELPAIVALRRAAPGVPLARARHLVAELTGVPSGR